MSELLRVGAITAEDIGGYVRRHATVIEQFDHLTQDSGNVSWLVKVEDQRLFVKTAGGQGGANHGGSEPYFDHAGRVNLLRNAVELAGSCSHSALPRLLNVIESPSGPALVYEAATGDLVRVPPESRDDPDSAYQRFAHLPAEQLLGVFDVLIDLHVALEAAGWIAVDLYDGCMIVDFASGSLAVIDLDTYRRGPSVNDMGRMFGSSRFMAPEEFELGRSSTSAPPSSRWVDTSGTLEHGSPRPPRTSAAQQEWRTWFDKPVRNRHQSDTPRSGRSGGRGWLPVALACSARGHQSRRKDVPHRCIRAVTRWSLAPGHRPR